MSGFKEKLVIALAISVVVVIVGAIIFWAGWMHFVDKHELGYVFDRFTGEIQVVEKNGWVIRTPIRYSVNTLDMRPYQVSITVNLNISSRILNAKLVKFDPDGLDTFIAWHGCGAGDSVYELREILKCYAFDRQNGEDCPFLTVVSELSPDQGMLIEEE